MRTNARNYFYSVGKDGHKKERPPCLRSESSPWRMCDPWREAQLLMPDAYIFPHTGPPNGPIVGRKDGRKIEAYLLSLRSVVAAEGLDELATGSSTGPRWSVALRPHRGAGRAGGDLPSFNGATVVRGVATWSNGRERSASFPLQRGHGGPWRCDGRLPELYISGIDPSTGPRCSVALRRLAMPLTPWLAATLQRGHGGPWRCDDGGGAQRRGGGGPSTGPRWSVALRRLHVLRLGRANRPSTGPRWSVALRPALRSIWPCSSLALQRGHGGPWRCDDGQRVRVLDFPSTGPRWSVALRHPLLGPEFVCRRPFLPLERRHSGSWCCDSGGVAAAARLAMLWLPRNSRWTHLATDDPACDRPLLMVVGNHAALQRGLRWPVAQRQGKAPGAVHRNCRPMRGAA